MPTTPASRTLSAALAGGVLFMAAETVRAQDLAWVESGGGRSAAVAPAGPGRPGFAVVPPATSGLTFTNYVPVTRHYTNQIYLNGSGVAAGDLDGDGRCEVILAGLGGRTALYRNLGGWRFENATASCGVDFSRLDVTGVAAADLDGDGDLDLVLNTVGQGTHLLENSGRGQFSPWAGAPTLNPGLCGSSCALADADGDGRLDLYVANYRVITARDEPQLTFTIGQEDGKPRVKAYGNRPISDPTLAHRFKFSYQAKADGGASVFHDEQGEPDALYLNRGAGRWAPVSWADGTFLDEAGVALAAPPFDWGLCVLFRDLNGDGAPDLYVGNDFATPDRIWINDGRGRFRALPAAAIRQTSLSTMAVDVADVDRDGFDDVFTADMLSPDRWRRLVQINQANPNMHLFVDVATRPQAPRNTLQRNRGDGTYEEIAQMAGLEGSDWSWASVFLDVDLDGFEDLLVANGFERDFMNMDAHRRVRAAQARLPRTAPVGARLAANRLYPRLATPNLAFRNRGDGRFADVSRDWGFAVAEVSQGLCLADLDNDGDQDVILNNLNGPATLLRNDTITPRLAIRLRGQPPNTRGIGARIVVRGGAVPFQSQEMIAGGRYLSSDDPMRVFAAGSLTNRLAVEVRWRSGRTSAVSNLAPNQIFEIQEPAGHPPAPRPPTSSETVPTLLADVSERLAYQHRFAPVDDFAAQPQRPLRLSRLGPGLSWFDFNADGWDDLVVPGTNEQLAVIFENDRRGGFVGRNGPGTEAAPGGVVSTVLGLRFGTGGLWLSGVSAQTSMQAAQHAAVYQSPLGADSGRRPTPVGFWPSSAGPMAAADVDGDGDLDLFVGGRFLPDHWPAAAPSGLWRQEPAGQWRADMTSSNLFSDVGLVAGAVFTDLDGDSDPDLVLACEWGPVRIFRNDRGRFSAMDWTLRFGSNAAAPSGVTQLSQLTGWWAGLQAVDVDGDGRLDLAVGNLGRNSAYERYLGRPVRVYYGTLAGDDSMSLLECAFDPELGQYAPLRDVWTLSKSLPWLLERFDGYEKFARVGIESILGERLAQAKFVEARWADTTVFLNRGDHFEVRPLAAAAQVSPVHAVSAADFDGDGHQDLFLGQNLFAVRPEASRFDAGRGLLLRGDGLGGFQAMPGNVSGILIYGEQRGAGVGDFDGDARPDLAVVEAEHGIRLLRNVAGRPGLRVRLQGTSANPLAIGAVLRLGSAAGWGPACEIHAGSGYWSQDSATLIMTGPAGATRLRVRWPGGPTTEFEVPAGARELTARRPE